MSLSFAPARASCTADQTNLKIHTHKTLFPAEKMVPINVSRKTSMSQTNWRNIIFVYHQTVDRTALQRMTVSSHVYLCLIEKKSISNKMLSITDINKYNIYIYINAI